MVRGLPTSLRNLGFSRDNGDSGRFVSREQDEQLTFLRKSICDITRKD